MARPARRRSSSPRTPAGQLLRVQMAPVHDPASEGGVEGGLSGFVLMLDDITRDFEQESLRDRLLHRPDRGQPRLARQPAGGGRDARAARPRTRRCASASRRSSATRSRAMTARLQSLAARLLRGAEDALAAGGHARRRPGRGRRAAHRSPRCGCGSSADEVDRRLWLKVDSYSLLQALAYLAGRLVDEHGVRSLRLRLAGRRSTGAARPGLDRPGDEHRDRDASWQMERDAQRRGRDCR